MYFLSKIKDLINIFLKREIRLIGNYNSWDHALQFSKGYSDRVILNKTIKSVKKVISNQAKFERDSYLFYEENFDETLLFILKKIKKKIKRKINLCDFGGSLGSLYFQHKSIFTPSFVDWNIVEQKHYVKYANKNIKIKNLNFYNNLNFLKKKKINVVLFSSSLQYLENPYKILEKIISKKISNIIIHRSPFTRKHEVIKIQKVPKHIYDASYPIRIINIKKMCNKLKNAGYKINAQYMLKEKIDGYFYETFYFEKLV